MCHHCKFYSININLGVIIIWTRTQLFCNSVYFLLKSNDANTHLVCLCHSSITIHWTHKNGDIKTTTAKVGMNLLEAARAHDIDLEGN